ncbi:MAG: DUF4012 domain-containing protein [Faecousia sp.]
MYTSVNRIYRSLAGCLAALLLFATVLAGCGQTGSAPETAATSVPEETVAELSVSDLLKAVLTLKDDLENAIDDAQDGNLEDAQTKVDGLAQKTETIRASLNLTMKNLGDSMSSLQTQLRNIQDLLDLVDLASETLLNPALEQIRQHPVSEMRTGDGVSTKLICDYLDFAESLMPAVETLVEKANSVDLSLVDSDGDIAEHLESANGLLDMYREDNAVFSRLKSIFGADGDRLYVVAAQNSAEIRASGGFPGAIGTIRIRDGVLILEDFRKVYNVLSSYTPSQANITNTERRLFHGGLSAPRDADFCPDFERVAYIWALGYEAEQGEHVDGVISMTPAIVQKLLAAMDEEIKLFDGTILDGDNAARVLQHDLYFQYFSNDYISGRDIIADQLFADTAKKTMQKLMENLALSDISEYLSIAGEGFQDRTLMLWMDDEAEQAILAKLGWNGGLNTDPEKPQAGIYYNCTVASKMGWFLIMDTEIGERVKNEDGSYTYPITVTFSNDMTQEEYRTASGYITGSNGGAIGGSAYFFAPAGGTVSDFTTSNNVSIEIATYHDLQLGYMRIFNIPRNKTVTVTYNVTTAPGVETPLTLSKTPTMQEYHE